jgi:hypothetical protein
MKNLTPQQLEALKAKAKERLQEQLQGEEYSKQPKAKRSIVTKALIKSDVNTKIKELKATSKLNIYRSSKEKGLKKTEIIESTREQLARKYHELLAEKEGYIESDKLMKKYAKKLLALEKEVNLAKQRLETPLDDYVELLRQRELEKAQLKKKIGFAIKTVFTLGYYAYKQGEKEKFLRTGGLK